MLRSRIETVEVEAMQNLETLNTEQSPERVKKSKIVRPVKRSGNEANIRKAHIDNFKKIIKELMLKGNFNYIIFVLIILISFFLK
jgi:hypothetical protein